PRDPRRSGALSLSQPDAGSVRCRERTGPRPGSSGGRRRRDRAGEGDRARAGASHGVTPAEQYRWLTRNVVRVYTEEEFAARLDGGRPLRVKFGVDPTSRDIHLGHTVPLTKLREFQDLGHQAVLIIGDVTAQIGDPSGRSATRPQLTAEEVAANAATYLDQVFKVLRRDSVEVRHNSEWFSTFSLGDVIRLAGETTVARMLERDDFQRRYEAGAPIGLHELLYPVMQGWDSVMVRADVEIGGTDQ